MNPKVLIVVTSHAKLGDTDTPTGIWVEELAVPYYYLLDAGVELEIASPQGGAAPLEPKSLRPVGQNDPRVERFLSDPVAQGRTVATRKLAAVPVTQFDAIFFPGGHGTMWDLPVDAEVRDAVEMAERAGLLIAAVCHGPAGLVSARRADGQPLVAGRRLTAFTDAEEAAVGLTGVVPFLLESRLRELGASFLNAADWQPFAVRDGRLITGQNPASSAAVADLVLVALFENRRAAA